MWLWKIVQLPPVTKLVKIPSATACLQTLGRLLIRKNKETLQFLRTDRRSKAMRNEKGHHSGANDSRPNPFPDTIGITLFLGRYLLASKGPSKFPFEYSSFREAFATNAAQRGFKTSKARILSGRSYTDALDA